MPKKIIIVRHGETQDNVERRFQGWVDTPLNKAGLTQAELIAKRLAHEAIDVIYTSDLLRARVTAEYIAHKHKLPVINTQSLREHHMGIFQGWQWEKETDEHKKHLWALMQQAKANGDWDWKEHSGESLNEHKARVATLLDNLSVRHNNQTIVLVTHGGTVNRIMEYYQLKKDLNEYIGYGNTSLTILEKTTTTYSITLHNDTNHLNVVDNTTRHTTLMTNDE